MNFSKHEAYNKMVSINEAWCINEEFMGEMAALEVACEEHGVDSQWFYDHIDLIAVDANE